MIYLDAHLSMATQKPKIVLEGPATKVDGAGVVDFQATRCSLHVKELQRSLKEVAVDLAEAAGCILSDLSYLDDQTEEELTKEVYAVFDFVDFKTTKRKQMLRATWAPFVVFVDGQQVLRLQATYDSKGARLSGVTLVVDGKQLKSRCRKSSVAKKILLSHIRTYVRNDEQEI